MSSMTFLAEDASEDDRQSARESSYGASDASESPNDRMSRLSISSVDEEAVHIEIATANLADVRLGIARPEGYVKLGTRLPFRVPRTLADLSTSWLTKALRFRKYLPDDASVEAVETKPIGEGGGVMGDIGIVMMTLSANAPESCPRRMVAKFSPQGKAPLPRIVMRAIFKSESHFYNDFSVRDAGLSRPECYFALYDARRAKPTFCMLVEDMMPAVGFTRIKSTDELERCQQAVCALARLHARWWEHPKKAPLDWLVHPTQDLGGLLLRAMLRATHTGMASLSRIYADVYAPIAAWMPQLRRYHQYIQRELFKPPLTMCHGDAHIENVFYHPRFAGGCAFIDFGNMMFGPGVSDVAFFMVHSLDVDVRRNVEEATVRAYHAALIANGVDEAAFPWERCWRDYRFNLWRALLAVMTIAPSLEHQHKTGTGIFSEKPTKGDATLREMYDKLNERCVAALLDHDWLSLVLEGTETCVSCGCVPFCNTICY